MEHKIYKKFLAKLEEMFPQAFLRLSDNAAMIKPELISPFVVSLPKDVLFQAQEFISATYQAWQQNEYCETVFASSQLSEAPANQSVMTCFDFHYSPEIGLKLIEVNTNSSLFWPFQILRNAHELPPLPTGGVESLTAEFLESYQQIFAKKPTSAIILDHDPAKEGLYFEFFLNQEWLERQNLQVEILSLAEFNQREIDQALVYNRTTDFYFERPESEKLNQLYLDKQICLTPNPRGYRLMADKRNLAVLRKTMSATHPELALVIPESKLFKEFESLDEIWSQRKKYFFKPSNSFGGKAAFAGKGISKKMFQSIANPEYMAQELAPAGKMTFNFDDETIEHKFDLRFYSNSQGIIDIGARLYQGQTTNMRTPLGGIAPVIFN